MHDVEQGLPGRERASSGSRRHFLFSWKVLLPIAAIVSAVVFWPLRSSIPEPPAVLTYTELVRAIDVGRVASMDIEPGYGVRGRWKTTTAKSSADFVVLYSAPDPSPLLLRAEARGVTVSFRPVGSSQAYRGWISGRTRAPTSTRRSTSSTTAPASTPSRSTC